MSEFVEVNKDRFFAFMNKNVHPRPEKDHSLWIMQDGSHAVIGKSEPGYLNPGDPKRYWIKKG